MSYAKHLPAISSYSCYNANKSQGWHYFSGNVGLECPEMDLTSISAAYTSSIITRVELQSDQVKFCAH